jgi:hypothetical protein
VPERDGAARRSVIVGPICESGDVLAEERMIPMPEEGDLAIVGNARAYGFAMASHENLRAPPAEVLIDQGEGVGGPVAGELPRRGAPPRRAREAVADGAVGATAGKSPLGPLVARRATDLPTGDHWSI